MQSRADAIVVRAPATSANLGPGFDCLGLTLDLWNEVVATPGATDPDNSNLILRSARAVFDEVGAPYPGFTLAATNRIPFSSGLGSSAAAIACGVLLANHCLGGPLDLAGCLRLAVALEGHADNVAPCLLGGVQVATLADDGAVIHAQVPLVAVPQTVVFVPDERVQTAHARGRLPRTVPFADAQFNVARANLLVAALAGGDFDLLAEATRDRLHQPYRLPLFPAGAALLDAAVQAGALGACVSGAGPSILALCRDDASAADVASMFERSAAAHGVAGSTLRLPISDTGAHVAH